MVTIPMGREVDFGVLRDCLDTVVNVRQPQVVLVRGEPGIGKTTLLRAFMDYVRSAPSQETALVGYGQAMTNSLGSDAFQAIRECLRSLVSSAERSRSQEKMARVARAFADTAPDWLESVPVVGSLLAAGMKTGINLTQQQGPDASHFRSQLDQLIILIQELLEESPLVLLLDDLHWADNATIDIVMALALKIDGPLLLVIAYRPDDLRPAASGEPHPLVRAVFRIRRYRPDCRELDLHRLSPVETRALIESVAERHHLNLQHIDDLVGLSSGIPLYAESLVLLADRERGSWTSPTRDIGAVLEERLSFAAPEQVQILETAVLIGLTFEVVFLADLLRADIDDVYDQLDVLMREHHLVIPAEPVGDNDRYALFHPLLGDLLRGRVMSNGPRWRRMHQRLVNVLLGRGHVTDELAVRAAAAALIAKDGRAASLALDAARRQYRAGAITKATELAGAAMDASAGNDIYFEAAELLVQCLTAEGNHEEVVAVVDRALARTTSENSTIPPEKRWGLLLLQARSLRMDSNWDEATAKLNILRHELGLLNYSPDFDKPSPDVLRPYCETLLVEAEIHLCGPIQDTVACISRCEEVIGTTSDNDFLSRAEGHRGLAHLAAYRPAKAETCLRASTAAARIHGHPFQLYEALFWHSKKKLACMELDAAWNLLENMRDISQRTGVAASSPVHLREGSRAMSLRGDLPKAAQLFVAYFDVAPDIAVGQLVALLAGQLAEVADIHGANDAEEFVGHVATSVDHMGNTERRFLLTDAVNALRLRPSDWRPFEFAIDVLHVARGTAEAADMVFRFNVPDLGNLRRLIRTGAIAPS